MTSNVGATGMTTTTDIGFRPQRLSTEDEAKAYERMKNRVLEEVKQTFRPEFLNRVDEVLVFHQLTREQIEQIVTLELEKVIREVRAQEMELKVTDAAKALLATQGLGSAVRRASAAPRDSAHGRGRDCGGDAQRRLRLGRPHSRATSTPTIPEKLKYAKIPSVEPPAAPPPPEPAVT